MIIVSVVIPIYNSEQYLSECILSIINQTNPRWELILVNDGSTDRSNEIIREFANDEPRIKSFSQRNQGQSAARNLALSHVSGDYVMFVDSDDAISVDIIENFINIHQSYPELDCYQFPVFHHYGTATPNLIKYSDHFYQKGKDDFLKLLLDKDKISWIVCNKIIKKSIAIKIQFQEGMVFEDNYYVLDLLKHIVNIYTASNGVYYYYERKDSTTTSLLSLQKELDTLKVITYVFSFLEYKTHKDLYIKNLLKVVNVKKSLSKNFAYKMVAPPEKSVMLFLDILKCNLTLKDKIKLFLAKINLY